MPMTNFLLCWIVAMMLYQWTETRDGNALSNLLVAACVSALGAGLIYLVMSYGARWVNAIVGAVLRIW